MINLLPHEIKEDISYARRNTKLFHWLIAAVFALLGVILIVAAGLLFMQHSISQTNKQTTVAQDTLKIKKVDETQKKLEEISTNTKLVVDVLSKEILFSKLLRQIGSTLPSNTALKSLQIDKVQGGVQLNAGAKDFNAATQLQVNLQDPKNGVFEKADINSITCGAASTESAGGLSCDVNLRALFSKDKSFTYLNPANKGVKQ